MVTNAEDTEIADESQEKEDCECSNCDDIDCKCNQIMINLTKNIDLTSQIGHDELHNIFLTIFTVLKYLENNTEELAKIESVCQEVYKNLNPKEMGRTLN